MTFSHEEHAQSALSNTAAYCLWELGVDILEQKITMPLLGAMANAPEQEDLIRGLVKDIPGHPEYRDQIVAFGKENDGLGYAEAKLDEYVAAAVQALSVLPESFERKLIIHLKMLS